MTDITDRDYARPDALVSTDWVAEHFDDPGVRILESNEDQLLYHAGHVPGALEIDWTRDLNHPLRRDYLGSDAFAALMGRLGITPDTTVVFYGDQNNWWACYAFWVFQLFGHTNAKIMDGGRIKWENEGREMTKRVVEVPSTQYPTPEKDEAGLRAFRADVQQHIAVDRPLIDVRSPEEYSGERLHMPAYPNEGALRGGHIPGAANIPWGRAVAEDGTFKAADDLRAIYEGDAGLDPEEDVVVYCRIGERSSHTWFVLHYLLGYDKVRNYDGSWTEWGNLVDVPIER